MVDIIEYTNPDFFFADSVMNAVVIVMRAIVNDPVHIQVQVVCVIPLQVLVNYPPVHRI